MTIFADVRGDPAVIETAPPLRKTAGEVNIGHFQANMQHRAELLTDVLLMGFRNGGIERGCFGLDVDRPSQQFKILSAASRQKRRRTDPAQSLLQTNFVGVESHGRGWLRHRQPEVINFF